AARREVAADLLGRAGLVQALVLEVLRLGQQALEPLDGGLDVDVDDLDVEVGQCEALGDPAAHVPGTDNGDGGDGPAHSWLLGPPAVPAWMSRCGPAPQRRAEVSTWRM